MFFTQSKPIEEILGQDDEFSGLDPGDIIIVVVGRPEVGMRTFINSVEIEYRSRQIETSSTQRSRFLGQKQVMYTRFFAPNIGQYIVLVQVPGFDTKIRGEIYETNLQNWMRRLSTSTQNLSLHGILYLHSILDKKNLVDLRGQLESVCEKSNMAIPKRAFVATTKWDGDISWSKAESRQKGLQKSWEKYWAKSDTNVQVLRLERSIESDMEVLYKILDADATNRDSEGLNCKIRDEIERVVPEQWVEVERTVKDGTVFVKEYTLAETQEEELKDKEMLLGKADEAVLNTDDLKGAQDRESRERGTIKALQAQLKEAKDRELRERVAKEAALNKLESRGGESCGGNSDEVWMNELKEALYRESQQREDKDALMAASLALVEEAKALNEDVKEREDKIWSLEQDVSDAHQREERARKEQDELRKMKEDMERQLGIFEQQIQDFEAKVTSDRETLEREHITKEALLNTLKEARDHEGQEREIKEELLKELKEAHGREAQERRTVETLQAQLKEARDQELRERMAKEAALKKLENRGGESCGDSSDEVWMNELKEALYRESQQREDKDALMAASLALEEEVADREDKIRSLEQDVSDANQREERAKKEKDELSKMKEDMERQLGIYEQQIHDFKAKFTGDRETLERERNAKEALLNTLKETQNHAPIPLHGADTQMVVDILSHALTCPGSLRPDERKRALRLLCKFAKSEHIFPKKIELTGVECDFDHPVNGGGYGIIYKGTYQEEVVCIKAVRMYQIDASQRALRAHASELVLGTHVSHPNVLPFYGAFISDESRPRICITSPWMECGNLVDHLNQHPDASRILLVSDILAGLQHLHDMGIIHSDLKGANVLISRAGRAMLADFGVSRIAMTNAGATTRADSAGTPNWMAPELLATQALALPTRESDIWAFGCVCYEILTGKIPFEEYRPVQLIHAFMLGGTTPPRPSPNPAITFSEEIWSLAEACFHYDPSKRPTVFEALEVIRGLNVDRL